MIDTSELAGFLEKNGASLVGFADLSFLGQAGITSGVSIAVKLPRKVVREISDGPTFDYYDAYHDINKKLDFLCESAAEYLREKGFEAFAQTTSAVSESADFRTMLPHKTVATASGLGWIGKSALFVSFRYGSAVRLTSVLTDAVFDSYAERVVKSFCPADCSLCKDACPGKAISGKLWSPLLDRDDFFDALACRSAARALAKQMLDKEITLCGKCILVCPYTQKYLKEV